MEELLKALAPLGAGGVLAGLVLLLYHKARNDWQARSEKREDVLVGLVQQSSAIGERQATAHDRLAASIEKMSDQLHRSEIELAKHLASAIQGKGGG